MTIPKVLITRKVELRGLEKIFESCQIDQWESDFPISKEELLKHVRDKDGLLVMLTDRIDKEVMDAAGVGLKVISTFSVGVDHIDLTVATQRGIAVGHTPGVLTEAVADFTFALLLAAARRVVEGDAYVRSGDWQTWGPVLLMGKQVFGATLGIVGFGRIGQAVARRAKGFGMRVLFYDRQVDAKNIPTGIKAEKVDLDKLLGEADFVSVHVPLSNETRHMFNNELFRKMKTGAILVNTSRGPVVDQAALFEALSSGKIASAGLDVFEPEPLPIDSPLLKLKNIILAPHIASASRETREAMLLLAAENLLAGLNGKRLPCCANPEVYGKSKGFG